MSSVSLETIWPFVLILVFAADTTRTPITSRRRMIMQYRAHSLFLVHELYSLALCIFCTLLPDTAQICCLTQRIKKRWQLIMISTLTLLPSSDPAVNFIQDCTFRSQHIFNKCEDVLCFVLRQPAARQAFTLVPLFYIFPLHDVKLRWHVSRRWESALVCSTFTLNPQKAVQTHFFFT